LGMSLAFVQRFAEHRVSDPARAVRCLQLYEWWQLLTGFVLFVVAGGLACTLLPHTRYALFSRIVLLRTAMQVPGMLSLFTIFFQAAQRFDYQLGLDLLEKRLIFVALPIPLVLFFRALGRAHPEIGEPLGAIFGIAAGQYSALLVTFVLGLTLYRRLGLPVGPLFHAGFDRETFRDMLRFGVGVVAGRAPYYLANAAEIGIITALLPGYPAWLGIRQLLMGRLVFTLWFMLPFIDSGVPAFSEALAARKLALARYYVVRYLQFGNLFVALVIGFLLGAGRALILHGLSPDWRPAATYLPLAVAVGAFLPAAWVSDSLQKGAGRSGLDASLLTIEQLLRVGLFYVLIPHLGFAGIFVSILIAIALKASVAWWVNHRFILRIVAEPWSTMGAPAVAGLLWYATLAAVARLLPDDAPHAIGLFVVGALCTFPLGFFVCGLVGGLDDAAVREIREAAELASIMRPVARRLAKIAAVGARWSPFRRPAPSLAAEAAREADEIAALERL
jgi:O-antigen/teichoic acid export membrane protein